jgi:hypothetical protein
LLIFSVHFQYPHILSPSGAVRSLIARTGGLVSSGSAYRQERYLVAEWSDVVASVSIVGTSSVVHLHIFVDTVPVVDGGLVSY